MSTAENASTNAATGGTASGAATGGAAGGPATGDGAGATTGGTTSGATGPATGDGAGGAATGGAAGGPATGGADTNAAWLHPRDLAEALSLRAEHGAVPLAGATDLCVRYRGSAGTLPAFTRPILFIGRIKELCEITVHEHELRVGAAAVYTEVAAHPATPAILKRTIAELAAPQLRNVGTIGGNIGNASPAGDAVCTLYALNAEVELASRDGRGGRGGHGGHGGRGEIVRRRVPIEDVITGPGQTAIGPYELITAVFIPLGCDDFSFYRKVGTRRANALSKLAFAACGTLEGRAIGRLSLAIGAVGPTVIRSRALEERLQGADWQQVRTLRNELVDGYLELISPIDDQRSSSSYRRRVTKNLLAEFFDRCLPGYLHGSH